MNPRTATLAAGGAVGIVAMQSLGLFGGGAPCVLTSVHASGFPAFMGLPPLLVVGLFVALFFVWRPSLFSGESRVPVRTLLLLVIVSVLSAVVFVTGWNYGIKYQGALYIQVCLVLSGLLMAACIVIVWLGRQHPSFHGSLALQALLFARKSANRPTRNSMKANNRLEFARCAARLAKGALLLAAQPER